jgi:hypothetical protein
MTNSTSLKRKSYAFSYHTLRNISGPEDKNENRTIYTGQAPISSILDLPTNANVRGYLVEADGKKRRSETSVHKKIKETLREAPENFSVLNSGVVIVAMEVEVDDNKKILNLSRASIINGSQTQGVCKNLDELGLLPKDTHIKFEIIVTTDQDLIAEISIARNFQNDVMSISIAGRRGYFDELEKAFQRTHPDLNLRKSESELPSDSTIDTEKLLQVITALIPSQLWYRTGEEGNPNKVYTYSMKARCLKEFEAIYDKAHYKDDSEHKKYLKLYNFYLDISGAAWGIYLKWKQHQGFIGTGLKNGITREPDGSIADIADGIVFPIISSLSVFAKETSSGWKIKPPKIFSEMKLIQTAKTCMTEIAAHNPWSMGKSKACYSQLLTISSLYEEFESQS